MLLQTLECFCACCTRCDRCSFAVCRLVFGWWARGWIAATVQAERLAGAGGGSRSSSLRRHGCRHLSQRSLHALHSSFAQISHVSLASPELPHPAQPNGPADYFSKRFGDQEHVQRIRFLVSLLLVILFRDLKAGVLLSCNQLVLGVMVRVWVRWVSMLGLGRSEEFSACPLAC